MDDLEHHVIGRSFRCMYRNGLFPLKEALNLFRRAWAYSCSVFVFSLNKGREEKGALFS